MRAQQTRTTRVGTRWLLVAAVVALTLFGMGLRASSADAAKVASKSSASGTANCTVAKGKLAVSPGLTFTGTATSASFTFTGKLSCTGTSGVTAGTLTATGTSNSNSCVVLASSGIPQLTTTIAWKGKYSPSTVVFSDGNFSLGTAITIQAPSTGPSPPVGTATTTGSFAFEPAIARFVADQTVAQLQAGCNSASGITGFTFTGVNGTSTFDISQQQVIPPPPPPASGPVTVGVDASRPGAAVNQDLLGVNHVLPGSPPLLKAIGVPWARTDAALDYGQGTSTAAYNCTTGAWDPSYLDSNIALDKQAGAQVELIVDYLPSCIADRSSATDQAAWEALVYQMAYHEITAEGVRTFEVYNEPSFRMPLTGATGYEILYKNTAKELEKAAKAAGVTIAVGGPANDELGQIDNSWISGLVGYVVKSHLPLDFLAWHQYPNDPNEGPQSFLPEGLCETGAPANGQPCWYNPNLDVSLFERGAQSVHALLANYPSIHPFLWIDEWGVDSGNDARLTGPYAAAFVAASLDSAQQGGVDRMAFYDAADNPYDTAYDNFGLLYANSTPKPVYDAFAMWHQLSGSLLPITLTPDQSGSGPVGQVGAVASQTPGGTVNVMVYNFAPYDASGVYGVSDPTPFDHQVTVALSGLVAGSYSETRTLIDGQNTAATVDTSSVSGSTATFVFNLSGEGVTLLTLTPTS